MAQTFPTTLNTHKKDWGNTTPVADTHPEEHNDIATAVEALEAKVGANASVVTTSHDYKLSEVTGSDKAVGETATQTLENKTLSQPVINTPDINTPDIDGGSHDDGAFANPTLTGGVEIDLGSDATGDIYYRNSSGDFVRLAIGSNGQQLQVQAGIPSWQTPAASSVILNAYLAADAAVNTTAATKVAFDTEGVDTGADFAAGTFTVPETGYYLVTARLLISTNTSSLTDHTAFIYKNGSAVVRSVGTTTAGDPRYLTLAVTEILSLTASDTIEVYYQSGNTVNTVQGGAGWSALNIVKL